MLTQGEHLHVTHAHTPKLPACLPAHLSPTNAGGVPSYFTVGADYNLGGPHTLGDLAAGIEWAPTLITASPAVLAASQTKRQSALPLSAARAPAAAAAAAAGLGATGLGMSRDSGTGGRLGRAGLSGLWNNLAR